MTKSTTTTNKTTMKSTNGSPARSTQKRAKIAEARAADPKAPPVAGTPAHEREQDETTDTRFVEDALDSVKRNAQETSDAVSEAAGEMRDRAASAGRRTADRASRKLHETRESLEGAYHAGAEQARETAARARETYDTTTRRAGEFAREHPFAVGAMGLVAGFALGALLPRTSREDRAFGERRDDLLHRAARSGEKVLRKGRVKAEETLGEFTGKGGMTDEERLEEGLEDTFPASDPVSATSVTGYDVTRN